jgi:hypothetical protein
VQADDGGAIEVKSESGAPKAMVSSLEGARVTQRALKMTIYMPQDRLQGVDDAEWDEGDDDGFNF